MKYTNDFFTAGELARLTGISKQLLISSGLNRPLIMLGPQESL